MPTVDVTPELIDHDDGFAAFGNTAFGGSYDAILFTNNDGSLSPPGTNVTSDGQLIATYTLGSCDPYFPTIQMDVNGSSFDSYFAVGVNGGGPGAYQLVPGPILFPGLASVFFPTTAVPGDSIELYAERAPGPTSYNFVGVARVAALFDYWTFVQAHPDNTESPTNSRIKLWNETFSAEPTDWQLRATDDGDWDNPGGNPPRPRGDPTIKRLWWDSLPYQLSEIMLFRHTFRIASGTSGTLTVQATEVLLEAYLDDAALIVPVPTVLDYESNEYAFGTVALVGSGDHILALKVQSTDTGCVMFSDFTADGETKAHAGAWWLLRIAAAVGGGGGYYQLG